MIIRAELKCKQTGCEADPCAVDKVIELPSPRFKQFSRALLADYDFIAENKNAIRHDEDARHCLLILDAEGKDGFLVDPQGYNYARYSAFVPNARSLLTPDMGIDRSYLSPAEPWRDESRDEMLRMTLRVDGKPDYTLVLPADEDYLDAVKNYLDIDVFADALLCDIRFKVPYIGELICDTDCPAVEDYNDFAEALEGIWQKDGMLLTYAAVLEAERPDTLRGACELLRNLDNYQRITEDAYGYGQQRLQETLGLDDEAIYELEGYMDFEKYGQDCMENDCVTKTEFGLLRRLGPPFPEQTQGQQMFMYKRFLGYKKGADGEPEIVPSEAAIVERIFNLYLAGETVDKISKMMQVENYDIPDKTISFSKGMIMNMLSNERYCGDAILQKSVTIDCIEKKRKKNTGEAPMYYVQNNHPAIIDRVTFNKVQEELARRKTKTPGSAKSSITSTGKYSRYALTDVLICGNCGTRYRRVTWSRNGVKRIVWRCISRLDYGKKYCGDSPTIMEDKLQEAIVRAVNKFNEQDNATYKALMRATISEALGLNGDPEEVDMLERKVEALNNKMLALVNESVSSGDGIEAHESEFMTLSQETELLKQRIAAIQESTAKDNGEQSRLEQIQAIISERESKCMEYDDSIVRQMVECIKVYPGGKLEIIFGGGYLVEESV